MIFYEDAMIKIGGVMLPGNTKSIEVKHDALIEEQEIEGSSKKSKQATGYEDAKITIELILIDGVSETKEQKLATIQSLFKKAGQEKPEALSIVSTLTAIRNVKKVLFKSLGTKEQNTKRELAVSIELWQYYPVTITAAKTSTSSSSTTAGSATGTMNADYSSYLSDSRGQAPKLKNKTAKTTALDDYVNTSPLSKLVNSPLTNTYGGDS